MPTTRSATRYHPDLWLLSWLVLSMRFAPQTARLFLVGHMCLGYLLPTWQCVTSVSVKADSSGFLSTIFRGREGYTHSLGAY